MTQAITFSQFQLPSHAPSSAQWTLKLLTKLKKGRLEIEYYGNDDLDRLLKLIGLPEE